MKYLFVLITLIFSTKALSGAQDYSVIEGEFVTSEGIIPNGCFGQLISELNGDNSVAAIFINRASLRGCIAANSPYPGGNEDEISYEIVESLDNNTYKLKVCQVVHGSMRSTCDNILVQFVIRKYQKPDEVVEVLSLEKIGEW
mgnify:CR=1 FL=1